ncbi:glycoside hydrolase family 9 protein [Sphingomonas sp. HITSZ_GF]|uniref:glycoside hydrolase family 9 protein n=1 Tax=Sphingomonas sp. HITSZ_GF TaxID=3037247 RepID=UPI00240E4E1B|nr:glycoside hydrolase family 9 protein [Sphingomonas sp. HITSZ_GF]MDG2534066.1 glycoside hydrolase family 9 protein [Sphingomonas sp. HITSZ_GF]
MCSAPLLLGAQTPPPVAIDVNQLGFEPGDPKLAILRAGAEVSAWELQDDKDQVVMRGRTEPYGDDAASGLTVQRIDFSAFRTPGAYRLRTVLGESQSFQIRPNLYAPLARDALAFFYHQRAGVPIEARIVGAKWARPAGHPHEVATCFTGKDERDILWLGGCPYSLDVTGGWYDAGDHGKYVVNGGIALWTLLDAHERRPAALPAGPNGAPGLLDEARTEMEFLLRMQVPEGTKLSLPSGPFKLIAASRGWRSDPPDFATLDASGMAHQKVADRAWTALPTPPQNDTQERLLYPPTTSATLNLAATAAQCARIWKGADDGFAARCLAAAERAFAAALRNPRVYATNSFTGSGGYGDEDVSDEFYWAAAELFVTTGKPEYRKALEASPHFRTAPGEPGWPQTATLGTITLATRPSKLPEAEVKRLRAALVATADRFLADGASNGYRVPLAQYSWGSNGALLNRAMVLGVAGDLTHDSKYRAGVIDAIDYVLGRNPNHVSYVSGYGTRSMQHPHHRFWAPSLDPALPGPPPGVLSGGANAIAMADPVAAKMKGKCAPQRCWADDVHAYALNEVAINWNAPLVWVAAWLAD